MAIFSIDNITKSVCIYKIDLAIYMYIPVNNVNTLRLQWIICFSMYKKNKNLNLHWHHAIFGCPDDQ